MSRSVKGIIAREKQAFRNDGVAESVALGVAPASTMLHSDLQAIWPTLDADDIDRLIELAERLVQNKRGGIR